LAPASSALRDKILAADDIKEELVTIPEWGVTVKVRGFTGQQRAEYIVGNMNLAGTGLDPVRGTASLVIAAALDPETDEPVFGPADRDALMSKSGKALDTVGAVALRLSGMMPEAVEAAKKDSSAPPKPAHT
jgi:hypothetical protein